MNLLKRAAKEAQQAGAAAPSAGSGSGPPQGPRAPSPGAGSAGSAGSAGGGSTLGSSPPPTMAGLAGFGQRTLMGGKNSAFRSLVPPAAHSPHSPGAYDSSDSEEINVHEYDEDVSDYENKMRSLRQHMEEEQQRRGLSGHAPPKSSSEDCSSGSDSDVDVDSNPLSVANLLTRRSPVDARDGQPLQLTVHHRERD